MSRRCLVLVGVEEPQRSALRNWAEDQCLGLVECDDADDLPTVDTQRVGEVGLCVLQVSGDADASRQRIAILRKQLGSRPLVVLATGLGIDHVATLMRTGILDVIDLRNSLGDVTGRVAAQLRAPRGKSDDLVGDSPAMLHLREEVAAVAPTASTVLVTGETGVGKGLVARSIHHSSPRRDRPFVHVDCAALSPTLIESELFGHERGAFTGATGRRSGRFEQAARGTIFLDEIADLDLSLQAKLLRVLQDREYERLGGNETLVATARVVAATSRDLEQLVREGSFRGDLYFRLNVFHIHVPPLRGRLSDLPALVQIGLERIANQLDASPLELSDAVYEAFAAHRWPGNVRELMNLLERAMVRQHAGLFDEVWLSATPDVSRHGLPAQPIVPTGEDAEEHLEAERDLIARVLVATGGNVARASRRLGIPRTTLRYRIRVLGLESLLPRD